MRPEYCCRSTYSRKPWAFLSIPARFCSHSSLVLQYAPISRVTGPFSLGIVAGWSALVFCDGGADIPVCHVGEGLVPSRSHFSRTPWREATRASPTTSQQMVETPRRGVFVVDLMGQTFLRNARRVENSPWRGGPTIIERSTTSDLSGRMPDLPHVIGTQQAAPLRHALPRHCERPDGARQSRLCIASASRTK
jgi:hypothetical protein